ncbi:MAG: hypothetical protein PHG30_10665, partial [Eubacteriales bacterium]|nr:hypothetical protein [Eubacteriales bacterium]
MSYEILHFRNANQIIKEKKMAKEVKGVMDYLNDCLYGTQHKSELLRQALTEMNWRQNGDLNILDGRRRKLPLKVDMLKVEFSGILPPGGSNEEVTIYRNPDYWDYQGSG